MKRVGIVGGGQLARMLALAGHPLGIECDVLDPAPDPSAASVLRRHFAGGFEDRAALEALADDCDVVTFDFENVTAQPLAHLAARVPVRPPTRALAIAQDRLEEKNYIAGLGIPVAPYFAIDAPAELEQACARLGLPLLVKTRRLGYDGKGQWRIDSLADSAGVLQALAGTPAIAEAWVPFVRELSIISVRAPDGEIRHYPLTQNCHERGVLAFSVAPAAGIETLQPQAEALARRLLEGLDYVGVLAIELFEQADRLIVNEIAPRVHNSGHWTIEGAHCSQFENHLRAVCDLPLGATAARGPSLMVNVLGRWPDREELLSVPGLHLHDYCKAERAGRKIGHLSLTDDSREALWERGRQLLQLCGFEPRCGDLERALAWPGAGGAQV
jgi:5-(carboxyamino)imidazole ribonucleotide synthase